MFQSEGPVLSSSKVFHPSNAVLDRKDRKDSSVPNHVAAKVLGMGDMQQARGSGGRFVMVVVDVAKDDLVNWLLE